jgi:hypothetical protein
VDAPAYDLAAKLKIVLCAPPPTKELLSNWLAGKNLQQGPFHSASNVFTSALNLTTLLKIYGAGCAHGDRLALARAPFIVEIEENR